jgi:hypothetical protein
MDVLDKAEIAETKVNAAGVRFVLLELDTGLLFCRLASISDSEDARRNEASAKRSYEAAIHHVKPLLLNWMERRAFDEKKERHRLMLAWALRMFGARTRLERFFALSLIIPLHFLQSCRRPAV